MQQRLLRVLGALVRAPPPAVLHAVRPGLCSRVRPRRGSRLHAVLRRPRRRPRSHGPAARRQQLAAHAARSMIVARANIHYTRG